MRTSGLTSESVGQGKTAAGREARRIGIGPALRQAWVGYRRRLDAELAAAGFEDQALPDGRVLRICSHSPDVTISQIGRELGMTRQGAGKIVNSLVRGKYVTLTPSPTNGREKLVRLAPRAVDYLAAHRKAAQRIERQLRSQVGAEAFASLYLLLDNLGGDQQPRLSDYLRKAWDSDDPGYLQR